MSSGSPLRLSAVCLMMPARSASDIPSSGQRIAPGETPLTRMCGPRSFASERVSIASPAFAGAVDGMVAQRPLRVHVDDVDDDAARRAQRRQQRLGQEQRRFEIAADEIVPLLRRDGAERRRIKIRRVVDEHVEPPGPCDRARLCAIRSSGRDVAHVGARR